MGKILVLCRRDDRESYDTRESMLRGLTAAQTANEYVGADFEDLLFVFDGHELTITDTVSGMDVADCDAIFLIGWFKFKSLDDVARAVAHYAHAKGIPFANSEAFHGRSFTKLSQCVIAALNGVSVTPFIFSMDSEILVAAAKEREELLGLPYIAKAVAASRGQNNYLIRSHEELAGAILQPADRPMPYIVQTFIPNDGDYRILVMGGQVRRVIHRQAQTGSHLNNTSQGGTATLTEVDTLPQRVIDDSVKLAQLLRREVTGVDMVRHRETGDFYFLEANNMPQLSTGTYVPEKLQALDGYLTELSQGNSVTYLD